MNRICDEERNQIRSYLHEPRFVDSTPREIVPTLLDEGASGPPIQGSRLPFLS